jgi:hypothetical protein
MRPSPRVPTVLALAAALAYGVGGWMVALHLAAGEHARAALPFLAHWLRDASLALPLVLLAAWAGLAVAGRLAARLRLAPAAPAAAALAACLAATGAALAFAAAAPALDALFGVHQLARLPLGLRMARDGLLALPVGLLLAVATLAIAAAAPARPRRAVPGRPRRLARLATATLVAATLVSSFAGPGKVPAQAAPAVGGAPCPDSAPVKRFDVTAVDVDIPLNRFGDHDPAGKMYVLSNRLDDVRAEERSQQVSTGLRGDAIQPLVIRANQGDCVEIDYLNDASGGSFGIHVDGLAYDAVGSGIGVGRNSASAPARGDRRTYRYFVPDDPVLEGAHYLHPGPGNRSAVTHGLFGALVIEPPGSVYLDPNDAGPGQARALESGWEATIAPAGKKAFRESALLFHEIGKENEDIFTADGHKLPTVDPHSDAYRPGTRAINYRSEPFMNRLDKAPKEESHGYASYTFGDPATPIPRGYLGDPTKFRLIHAGSEMLHVYHLHGGGDRWRFNPVADKTYDYADTGLNKQPKTKLSPSSRLDSQSFGPGESYNLEMEGGAGGVQQAAGDFLWHCHIAEHYVGGMWSFWRVYNTRQADFAVLPDRQAPPGGVDSTGLLGRTMPDGTTLTRDNLDDWIRPQLPTQGVPMHDQDASVWNWTIDQAADPAGPVYLGEPEDNRPWPDLPGVVPGHPSLFPGDELVGNRPKILFDPTNGRIAYPLLRPHIGKRPPFSPNGHSGAPWLGEDADAAPASPVSPWANRRDGLCPSGAPPRHFNVVAIEKAIQVTRKGGTDPNGMIYVLAKDKQAVLDGTRPAEPLAIRANVGDCVAVTLTSEQTDEVAADGFAKVNMHIHHVQFDPQASDGVISGMQYEQSVRPYKLEDPKLVADAGAGATTLALSNVAKFRPGVWIGVGLGTEDIEVHQITAVDAHAGTVTLRTPLKGGHRAGEWAGFEFVQYRWYPDVELDNVFWHDHVDGIHTWGHGLVGQLIVEPPGSTYHDPRTGEEVDSGTIVDIHTNEPLAEGLVQGSFREMALWQIDENPVTDSTINLRAEPFSDRSGDPSLRLSSYKHGDPYTPMPRAYPGDPVVIRAINVGPSVDTLHVDGHRFWLENRYLGAGGVESTAADTMNIGVSERFTVILRDGAGGTRHAPGDYLYMNGVGRRFRQGAWGILRVLPGRSDDLKPLPGTNPAAGPALPSPTGGRPPAAADPGSPCPAGAPLRSFDVSAIRLPGSAGGEGRKFAYVRTRDAAAVEAGTRRAEPLVLHAAAGDCVRVRLTNDHATDRVSFHVGELVRDPASSGANVGYTPEQTVARDETRTYLYYADTDKIGSALISDLGGDDTAKDGLYGALVVAPQGATFTDPVTWQPTDVGAQVDVHLPGKPGYRDFTLALADDDPQIGASFMPYPEDVKGPALVNYASAPRPDAPNAFSSAVHGDPATPILRAYAGDQVKVHALVTPGSEQVHTFNLGGLSWGLDAGIAKGNELPTRHIGPWAKVDAVITGGAGGRARAPGDYFYGDLRRPFTEAGMWGLQRVLPRGACPATPAEGLACLGQPDLEAPTVTIDAKPGDLGNDASPQFAFSASEPASFECSTSTGADSFRPCASPLRAGPLDDGTWTFKVRATDPAGNTGLAASHRFTVDTHAPTLTVSPAGGSYPGPQQVSVSTSEPAAVYYTDDGATPTTASRRYDGPLAVDASGTWKFLAVDEAGNSSAVATEAYTIAPPADTTAPSVTAPTARPLAGSQLGAGAGTVKVRVGWSASDGGSGVAGYELQQRTGTGTFKKVLGGNAVTADRTLQVGTTYQFRARATDAAGNQSGWSTGPAFRARLTQDGQAAVRYSAGWRSARPAGASGGTVRSATAAGATATLAFTGTGVAWVAPTGPALGQAEVWVDGARAATVDLRAATASSRRLVFAIRWDSPGAHTIQVRVAGTAGRPRVDVDGFLVMGAP